MAGSVDVAEVIVARSPQEAVEAFADGDGVTVVAGGTIVMPEITHGRLRPRRTVLIAGAGLAGIHREGARTTIGAATPVADLVGLAEPLARTAGHVADPEIRAQATLGGNLCAPPGAESPRGDLQAALIALGAQVRSAGAGGERTETVEDFLAGRAGERLVLDVAYDEPDGAGSAAVRRPHAHAYTVMNVCVAGHGDTVRVAVSGAGPHAARCHAVEQALAAGDDDATAAEHVHEDVTPQDDALASAWYRSRTLPVLVRRALAQLRGGER